MCPFLKTILITIKNFPFWCYIILSAYNIFSLVYFGADETPKRAHSLQKKWLRFMMQRKNRKCDIDSIFSVCVCVWIKVKNSNDNDDWMKINGG